MKDIMSAMRERHSVRAYLDRPIESETQMQLQAFIDELREKSGLNIQMVLDEPTAFSGTLAHYGSFKNCKNYFVICSENGRDEEIGYFGEMLVLRAQQLGLNTCWVALTYNKRRVKVKCAKGEKIQIVIAVGYGEHRGAPHKNKAIESQCSYPGDEMPAWFASAMKAARMAPTAVNQQKFHFTLLDEHHVHAKHMLGPCAKMDLGIVKYHFELGAGDHTFDWV